MNLIELLHDITTGKTDLILAGNNLDEEMKSFLVSWYSKYANNTEADIIVILDLLCFLYINHDIDVSTPKLFTEKTDYLSERFEINRDLFYSMLSDFRKLVYTNA